MLAMDRQPRKHKFAPKAPKSKSKPVVAKPEQVDGDPEGAEAQNLIRRFNETRGLQRPKVENKPQSQPQTAFTPGAGSSSSSLLRTFGPQRSVEVKDADYATNFHVNEDMDEDEDTSGDEYVSPWDDAGYRPISHPLRPPKSGDPEVLNEIEFVEAAAKVEYDENIVNAANELNLLEISEEPKLFLFQLPSVFPSPARKGKETSTVKFEDLPGGYMGKMLVYKSGKVKMKLGETLFDVTPGSVTKVQPDAIDPDSEPMFPPEAAVINTEKKECCIIGRLDKRAVVTPDIDSILASLNVNDLGSSEKKQSEETAKRKSSSGSPSKKQRQ